MEHEEKAPSLVPVDPYRELFEHSADAILIIEGETFVDCNQATVELLRYDDRQALLSTHPSEISPPTQPDGRDSREKAGEMIATAFAEGSHRFEWVHLRADGTPIPVEVLLTAVQRGDKRILHVVWRDLTVRKGLEEQLRHAQKMEAIGRLAGGIAHDFNNMLVAIIGNSELLAMELEDRPELLGLAKEITHAGDRAAVLVRQLLTFSRKQEIRPEVVDVGELIAKLHTFLERLIGEDVTLIRVPATEEISVKIDPGQLEQLLINLVTNARDALPTGGTITIEVRRADLGGEEIGAAGGLEAGSYAVLSVSDTGVGMDAETARRAFDPFFTTKDVGKGTGLGLATVHGIAMQSGGSATLYSVPGRGTTVKVSLPISLTSVFAVPRSTAELPTEGGDETILVVEDEASVSNLVMRVLGGKGYRLLKALNGEQAIAVWNENEGKIDLVLSDVVMPVMGGPEFVKALRESGNDPHVLFVSGYTSNALAALTDAGMDLDLLEKPFSAAELAGRVRLALDRK